MCLYYLSFAVVNTQCYVIHSREELSGTSSIMGSNVSRIWQQQQQCLEQLEEDASCLA